MVCVYAYAYAYAQDYWIEDLDKTEKRLTENPYPVRWPVMRNMRTKIRREVEEWNLIPPEIKVFHTVFPRIV